MADTIKVLGQSAPSATTLTTLYTVPASTSAVISTIIVCNRGSGGTFRIAVRPSGAAISSEHYIAYDCTLITNGIVSFTIGATLATTDVVSVYASTADFSFSLFGSEVT